MKDINPNAKATVSYSLVGFNYFVQLNKRNEIQDFERLAVHRPVSMSDENVTNILKRLNRRAPCAYDIYRTVHAGVEDVLPWKYVGDTEKLEYQRLALQQKELDYHLANVAIKLEHLNLPFFSILGQPNEIIDSKVNYVDPLILSNSMADPYVDNFCRWGGIAHYHACLTLKRQIPKNSKLKNRKTSKQIAVPVPHRLKVNERSLDENVRLALRELCSKYFLDLRTLEKSTPYKKVWYKNYNEWEYEFAGMPKEIDLTKMDRLKKHQLEKIARLLNLGKIEIRRKQQERL